MNYQPTLLEISYAKYVQATVFNIPTVAATDIHDNVIKISGRDAVPFMTTSGVDRLILRNIWSFADPNGMGYLSNTNQLCTVLRLISIAQQGLLTPQSSNMNEVYCTNTQLLPLATFTNVQIPDENTLLTTYGNNNAQQQAPPIQSDVFGGNMSMMTMVTPSATDMPPPPLPTDMMSLPPQYPPPQPPPPPPPPTSAPTEQQYQQQQQQQQQEQQQLSSVLSDDFGDFESPDTGNTGQVPTQKAEQFPIEQQQQQQQPPQISSVLSDDFGDFESSATATNSAAPITTTATDDVFGGFEASASGATTGTTVVSTAAPEVDDDDVFGEFGQPSVVATSPSDVVTTTTAVDNAAATTTDDPFGGEFETAQTATKEPEAPVNEASPQNSADAAEVVPEGFATSITTTNIDDAFGSLLDVEDSTLPSLPTAGGMAGLSDGGLPSMMMTDSTTAATNTGIDGTATNLMMDSDTTIQISNYTIDKNLYDIKTILPVLNIRQPQTQDADIEHINLIYEMISTLSIQLPQSLCTNNFGGFVDYERSFKQKILSNMSDPYQTFLLERAKRCCLLQIILTSSSTHNGDDIVGKWTNIFNVVRKEMESSVELLKTFETELSILTPSSSEDNEDAAAATADNNDDTETTREEIRQIFKKNITTMLHGFKEYVRVVRYIVSTIGDLLCLDIVDDNMTSTITDGSSCQQQLTKDNWKSTWYSIRVLEDVIHIEELWDTMQLKCEGLFNVNIDMAIATEDNDDYVDVTSTTSSSKRLETINNIRYNTCLLLKNDLSIRNSDTNTNDDGDTDESKDKNSLCFITLQPMHCDKSVISNDNEEIVGDDDGNNNNNANTTSKVRWNDKQLMACTANLYYHKVSNVLVST